MAPSGPASQSAAAVAPVASVPILTPIQPADPALSSGLGLPRLDVPAPSTKPAPSAPVGTGPQVAPVVPPMVPVAGLASQSAGLSAARPNRASVIIASVLGVLIGVIAVLVMQLMTSH